MSDVVSKFKFCVFVTDKCNNIRITQMLNLDESGTMIMTMFIGAKSIT
jgi:hypothetical protein